MDTVLLACCQQRQWRMAMAYHGDLEDHLSIESLEVMITACEGQHVHHVACKLLINLQQSSQIRELESLEHQKVEGVEALKKGKGQRKKIYGDCPQKFFQECSS